jgi:hypothetical protein
MAMRGDPERPLTFFWGTVKAVAEDKLVICWYPRTEVIALRLRAI